ncbi:hypothetical protein SUGI_0725680 [Cryptomeria japonica]|uniref:bifunctional cis-abienol synthase, chloroplastic-like n=1 Tax=Cryptomeria japonica TaxID=3369 RepID=UPI002414C469|nr:bifunctional cis-abienol synthase, chloroplastic-like [Cryptomeria japonica]GLJ36169.1 hypothetical protein SUGI_0725680 [Cryptomeria japonica]
MLVISPLFIQNGPHFVFSPHFGLRLALNPEDGFKQKSSPFGNYSRTKSPALTIAHRERQINPNYRKPDYIHSVPISNEAPLDEIDKRIEALVAEFKMLFNSMEDGEISPSAYDTVWVARVPAINVSGAPQFPQMVDWIPQNQLLDGSWGEKSRFLSCGRLLNTLACVVTLTIWSVGNDQVNKACHKMPSDVHVGEDTKILQELFLGFQIYLVP